MRRLPMLSAAVLVGLSGLGSPLLKGQAVPPDHSSILVLPFTAPSGGGDAWVGKAVQQDLLTDLTQGTTTRVSAPANATPAADSDEALKAGRDAGASIVVYGQAQNIGKTVRLSGQVLDLTTGKAIGALKATGPSDELFHLEDALAGQVFMSLPRTLLTGPTLQGVQSAAANQQQGQPAQPQQAPGSAWPNGPYAPPTVNGNSIYGAPQPQSAPPQPQPPYDAGTTYTNNYYQPAPVYGDSGDYYPTVADPYSYYGGLWPDFGLGFYVSPGWGYGYGGYGGYGHGRYGYGHGGHDGDLRGGAGRGFNGGVANGSGVGRSGIGSFSSGGFARSTLGSRSTARGSVGGFRSSGFSGGAVRSGGFGGGFHGGGSHAGGFSGGGGHGGGGGGHR